MKTKHLLCLAAAVLLSVAGPASSNPPNFVAGQKLDSALGELPHYAQWSDPSGHNPLGHRVLGESLDSGLGELPQYSLWLDSSARHWLGHRVPGESLDSGLGELPHYAQWTDPTGQVPVGPNTVRVGQARR